ncbi:helicase-like transcription factor isoform X2 [Latimeria chalumnae]|uniref:helicase-like transcription factor isoform X2 n=1 Tax=Latimeria chalumnae TaxID=7897 RepID=UPI00313C9CE4
MMNFPRFCAGKYSQPSQHRRFGSSYQFLSADLFFNVGTEETVSVEVEDSVAADEDWDSVVLFGALRGNVVGLRYYTGVVNNNEMVALQREPNNPYDRNAVKVNNVNGNQVGHIKKELAAALSYVMDNKLAKVEGVVPYGANNVFTMPVQLSFWGKEENKQVVLDHLKRHGYKLGPPPKGSEFSGYGLNWVPERPGPSYRAPTLAAIQMTAEQLKSEFDKLFEDLKEVDKTQEMEPADAVGTPLLPHQKQALAWMVSRENSKELPPFWEQRNNLYYNLLTNFAEHTRPENVRGGILGDDMGLGKTLSTIAVIFTNFHDRMPLRVEKMNLDRNQECSSVSLKHGGQGYGSEQSKKMVEGKQDTGLYFEVMEDGKSHQFETAANFRPKREHSKTAKYTYSSESEESEDCTSPKKKAKSEPKRRKYEKESKGAVDAKKLKLVTGSPKKRPRATLIICPLSVLSNWIDQFEQHIRPDVKWNLYIYYGPDRNKDPEFLAQQDVVLTTYNVLTVDYGTKWDSPLHKVQWLRVILDEGHTIRNPNAQQTKAALDLVTERRWLLTGTPIQNSLKDLWSLLSFLKLKPFTDREWWHRTIQRPVTMGDKGGLSRLQALVQNITLRRTKRSKVKGKPVVELPERKVFVQQVTLSEEERKMYDSMKNEGKTIIGRYFNEGTVLTHYADILAILVRLRQLCCHPHLVSRAVTSVGPAGSGNSTPEELRERLINKMKLVLNSGSDEECAICLDSMKLPVITHCAHVYCKPCICQVIRTEQPNAKCPLCRSEIQAERLVECPPEDSDSETMDKTEQEWTSSSKVDALMHALIELRKQDLTIKSLIVSQFTSFLLLLQKPLREMGFAFTRLDGSMTQKKRIEAIHSFQKDEPGSPTIMLLSLKAGGVGLNLTAASRVFLMDPAWNPAAEDQCFDRCHRLGQKRDVIITKFIIKDSVEENMMKIQNKKRELAAGAFGTKKQNPSEMKQARIQEIRTLIDM